MKIQVDTISPVEKKVTIEIDPDLVTQELSRAYTSLGRRVTLRGFRPGKAPRKVLERNFKEQIESEVLERLVGKTFGDAVKQESIAAVAPPHVQVAEPGLGEGRSLKYTARVEVKPRLEPKDYKALEATRPPVDVTDQMVADELTRLQEASAQLVPVEGRFDAQSGDYVVIDHDGTIDGMPFQGGKAEGVTVKVAPGPTGEGHMPQLEGKRLGETVAVEEAFPADHRVESLRNKVARLQVTLKGLKTRQVPSLDDELAKDLGLPGVQTLEELKKRIREDLEKREKRKSEGELRNALIKAALAKNDFEVPPALVERAIDVMLEGAADRFARQGIDIRQLNLDMARMRADLREQALSQVKGTLLLEAIADAEQIQVTDQDLEAETARIAEELQIPVAKVRQQAGGAEARAALTNRVREDKALAFLITNANLK
jgi:trigger factor